MDFGNLFSLKVNAQGLIVEFGWLFLSIVLLIVLGWIALNGKWRKIFTFSQRIVEAELSFANLGKIKIAPDFRDSQIAHKAWVELITRKAALPFDENNDVIVEIYNSWYEVFKIIRELIKEIPYEQVRNRKDTQKLVGMLVQVLNIGLRPHLTNWQAKFRRWYQHQLTLDANHGRTPQEIQKGFPEYAVLIREIKVVNLGLQEYADYLKKLSIS